MFTPLQKLFPQALNKIGVRREIEAALICEKYRKLAPKIVHADVLAHTLPQFYRRKILTIGVKNSAWAQMVIRQKDALIKGINEALGKPFVENITTKVY